MSEPTICDVCFKRDIPIDEIKIPWTVTLRPKDVRKGRKECQSTFCVKLCAHCRYTLILHDCLTSIRGWDWWDALDSLAFVVNGY